MGIASDVSLAALIIRDLASQAEIFLFAVVFFELRCGVVCAVNKLVAWSAMAFCKQSPCSSERMRTELLECVVKLGLNELPCASVSAVL